MTDFERRAQELKQSIEQLVYHFQAASTANLDGDLSLQENKVIDLVGQRKSCIMREISGHLRVAVSTTTGLIDKLEEKGLVRRERTDEDRRIVRISLTEKGEKIYQSHGEELMKLCRGVLRSLDAEEQDIYLTLAKKISVKSEQQFASDYGPNSS